MVLSATRRSRPAARFMRARYTVAIPPEPSSSHSVKRDKRSGSFGCSAVSAVETLGALAISDPRVARSPAHVARRFEVRGIVALCPSACGGRPHLRSMARALLQFFDVHLDTVASLKELRTPAPRFPIAVGAMGW